MSSVPNPLIPFTPIDGVYTVPLKAFRDERGSFTETFRQEWFPMVSWSALQMNRSVSRAEVLRGLHYHLQQVDYWLLLEGKIRVGLSDLRPSSATYGHGATLDLNAEDPTGLFIPVGVAHGFYAQTDMVLFYVVNQYYNGGTDERGIAWNDPALNVNWEISNPLLSPRDQNSPRLHEVPADQLPS